MSAPQEFERYPALASWIERLGNSPNGLSLGEWMIFVGALNAALLTARKRSAPPPHDHRSSVLTPDDPETIPSTEEK